MGLAVSEMSYENVEGQMDDECLPILQSPVSLRLEELKSHLNVLKRLQECPLYSPCTFKKKFLQSLKDIDRNASDHVKESIRLFKRISYKDIQDVGQNDILMHWNPNNI